MAQIFRKIQAGPSSYPPGGFAVQVGEFEKIANPTVFMDPTTKLGTSAIPGFHLTVASDTPNVVRVQVFQAWLVGSSGLWTETAAGVDLSAANFIVSGEGY